VFVLAAGCYGSSGPRRCPPVAAGSPLLPVARPLSSVAPTLTPSQELQQRVWKPESWGEALQSEGSRDLHHRCSPTNTTLAMGVLNV
jgi:hypothetical protein